ncbi:GNAT family N-acetyltransferase [Nonomuraea sp. MCN248]|uniref:GNAT family N-acetyltransferase n=1 Tax=Nonomuraea corallina TaxID=2989783 RepID=A0ABT4SID2_9ACTN|nr:GNAT family N-acetyltransferase [Nonomuraea corallina]MDA0636977.1 GNAT family N-acetyltransferase [Nonomuraea corallina]
MQRGQSHLGNPFLSPDFTLAMGEVDRRVRVAVARDGDGIAGFFPYEERSGVGAAVGAWVSLCQGVVHRPGASFDAAALLRACGLHVWEFGCLVARQPWFDPYVTLTQDAAVLDLADGWPAYLRELRGRSPKFLKSTLYKERKLGRDVGEVTSAFAVDSADEFALLRAWKSQQYRRNGRPDRFGRPWVVELVERLHAVDNKDFGGVLSMLYVGGTPVAGHFGLRSRTTLIGWFPAYDPRFAKYSPGLIQHLRMAEGAAEAGLETVDLSVGAGYEYKEALASRTVPVSEGVVRRRTARAGVHWARTEPVRLARRAVLGTPAIHRLADRALKTYGRRRSR